MESTEQQETRTDVVVVGGGLAGLAAAALVARSGTSVTLIDGGTLGGRARTTDRDGYRLNQGPHAVYVAGAGAAVLAGLGVTLAGGPPMTAEARVVYQGEVHRLPASPALMLQSRLLSLREKARLGKLLARLSRIDPAMLADRSVAQWLDELALGDAAAALISMLLRISTYVADLDRLSADAGVAQLRAAVSGPGVRYLDGGWQRMVDQLEAIARGAGASILTQAAVRSIDDGPGGYRVSTDAGSVVGRSVVVATGSPESSGRLLPGAPSWDSLGPDVLAACLDLGLATVPSPPLMFGMDEPLYLSTHCPPADLAPPGGSVVHVMRYGVTEPAADQAQLWHLAARVGIDEPTTVTHRFLPSMTVTHAIPVPGRGLPGRPGVEVEALAGAFVAGDWVGRQGLLADASLASAREAAAAAVAHVSHGAVTVSGSR